MMHPSPEEVRAEARYRGHVWAVGHAEPGSDFTVAIREKSNRAQCVYCDEVYREGRLPISHGCCRSCAEARHQELDEKDPGQRGNAGPGPDRSEATRASTPTSLKVGGHHG